MARSGSTPSAEELIPVRVQPRSSRAGIDAAEDGAVVVRVHAPAAQGAANRECIAVLAKALGVSKSAVMIVRGQKGRSKHIAVAGLSAAEAQARLARASAAQGRTR